MEHRNAPLTRTGRLRLVRLVGEDGLSFEAAAAASNVAKSTAHCWVTRWREASPQARTSLACLEDRCSRPRRSPRLRSEADHDRVWAVRRRTGWGPRLIATEVEIPHATVSRMLRRRGCSRRPRPDRGEVVRHEWPCPGELLQMDVKRFARFSSPGQAVTGDRVRSGAERRERVGYQFAHSVIDDHSRVAFTELHPDERAVTITAFFERALAFFRELGIEPRRVQTDNHFSYVKNGSRASCSMRRGSHTTRSGPARRATTARSSATSRHSSASGASASAIAHRGTGRGPCHTGSSTTTRRGDTQRSATAHQSVAFGTS